MVDSGKPTLTYFGLYGRAEACRMLMSYAKMDFVDNRIDKEAFEALKAAGKCPSGQVPMLECDGQLMN